MTDVNEVVLGEVADSNNESEWKSDSCDETVATEVAADFEDKLYNSTYDTNKPDDDATGLLSENVVDAEHEASASGWVGDVYTSDNQWNGTSYLLASDSQHSSNCRSHWFNASVVVNTGNTDRCEFI